MIPPTVAAILAASYAHPVHGPTLLSRAAGTDASDPHRTSAVSSWSPLTRSAGAALDDDPHRKEASSQASPALLWPRGDSSLSSGAWSQDLKLSTGPSTSSPAHPWGNDLKLSTDPPSSPSAHSLHGHGNEHTHEQAHVSSRPHLSTTTDNGKGKRPLEPGFPSSGSDSKRQQQQHASSTLSSQTAVAAAAPPLVAPPPPRRVAWNLGKKIAAGSLSVDGVSIRERAGRKPKGVTSVPVLPAHQGQPAQVPQLVAHAAGAAHVQPSALAQQHPSSAQVHTLQEEAGSSAGPVGGASSSGAGGGRRSGRPHLRPEERLLPAGGRKTTGHQMGEKMAPMILQNDGTWRPRIRPGRKPQQPNEGGMEK